VLTELGYPSHWGPVADYWVRNTPSHYCVMIDNNAQPTKLTGHLTQFADLRGLKLAEAQAKDVWGGAAQDYRRMLALLDTEEKSSLFIDAFFTEAGARMTTASTGCRSARSRTTQSSSASSRRERSRARRSSSRRIRAAGGLPRDTSSSCVHGGTSHRTSRG
jgi:hypothetical protein